MAAEGFLRSDLAPDPRTLVDVLEATARAHADAPAIDDGSTVLTYGELLVAVRAAAAGLAGAGIGPGDWRSLHPAPGRPCHVHPRSPSVRLIVDGASTPTDLGRCRPMSSESPTAVSYTHLTLPTILLV